ncbi:hypothetical protein [Pedobacter glucosidilyticus]|uniref:hypothetical protein n=1 Tax=Pedobacter glucosidilyticus TaxID=1122941 RepID=UPI00041B54D4|nr:hypothetical protein [Pedobacter glucosidilyticus]
MDISVIIFFFIILIYVASLVTAIRKKKFEGILKKVFKIVNLTAFFLTLVLIILWTFNRHLSNLTIEIIPFWTFIISSIIIFGLTVTNKIEKIFYGIIFYGHLFMTVILIIPFIGIGITSMVYSPFWTDSILYQDKNVIVTDKTSGFLAPKSYPTVYIKCGLLSHKFKTSLSPVYSIDSVSLTKIDNTKIEIEIHGDKEDMDRKSKQTFDCNCL